MKIVQIGGALNGAQKIIEKAIHHRAMELGHESYIFYAWGKSDERGIIKYENKIENLTTRALRKYVGKRSCYSAPQTKRLIRYIKRIKPDVIHLHVLHHGCTDYEMLFKYLVKAQIPVVYTMHDMWAFTGGCYHYTALGCTGYQMGCKNCIAEREYLDVEKVAVANSILLKESLFKKMNRIHFVSVSQWVKEEMLKGFLAGYPISVIPNGVVTSENPITHSNALRKSNRKKRLISVATTWTEKKGVHILFDLADKLGKEYEIWLVGAVTEDVRKNAPANVTFLGYCEDRKELYKNYIACDLYVGASKEETFGMTFVEAALAGTRSVGFCSTAITETLEMVHGICVREFSAEAMSKAITDAIACKNGKLTQEEIAQISDSVSITKMASSYLHLYQELLYDK